MNHSRSHLYLLGSFVAGFSIMTVELISSRIIAPILGNSLFTWTSVIGVTLLGLALGSFWGGKIADKSGWKRQLPIVFLLAAVFISIIPLLTKHIDFLLNISNSIVTLNLLVSFYLFLPSAIIIGFIQPIILKRYALNFSHIGSEYGYLSTVWSLGSILGVFLTGFFFISHIGSNETLWLISGILFIGAILFTDKNKENVLLLFFILLLLLSSFILGNNQTKSPLVLFEKETNYYMAKVADVTLPNLGPARILLLDGDMHSADPTTKDDPNFYPALYPVFSIFNQNIKKILVIGGGAYTMPKYFTEGYPHASTSVIEIDPELVTISDEYFDLKNYNIDTKIGDARIILEKDPEKYDLIFGDAYNSYISVPWHLLTVEWNNKVKTRLNDGGIYAINFIGTMQGPGSEFTESILSTFKKTFPNYYIFAMDKNPEDIQNIIIVGINSTGHENERSVYEKIFSQDSFFLSEKLVLKPSLPEGIILTDDFSPVEQLMKPIVQEYFPLNMVFLKKFQ
jgi:spermidine synthase